MQEKFKEFILNDIFWFNKSELNFGIYKIFRQKETFIKEKLDEIVENIETQLSSSNEKDLQLLKKELKDTFLPPKLQIDTLDEIEDGIKKYCNGDTDEYLQRLEALKTAENYDTTKVYEYLYQFFNLYYEKGDFGYTPRSFRTYSIPYQHEEYFNDTQSKNACENSSDVAYRGEETLFSWKTKDSYYIKSNKFLNSVTLNLSYKENDYTINTNIINKDENIKDDKKVKQYRLVSIKKENNRITLNFNISDFATPKHTIYLAMLSVIEEDIKELDYDAIFQDKKLKDYFENLPLKDTTIQTSLLDDTQNKLHEQFVKLMNDDTIVNYIIDTKKDKEGNIKSATNIFKYALSGEEDKTQLKSKTSKLMISKKEYASKLYSNTTAKEFLEVGKKEKFDIKDKKDYEKLYESDARLSFFYRLDRGINLFYAGVDSDYFIHKNLKRFLSVELDKFIKNYIFADTDAILLMDENAKKIATFARVFKAQANVFIDLLSSIEEFQKYLWEKRKMVKSSHYVVSSNKIENVNLLEIVLKNRNQLDEWRDNLKIVEPNEKLNIVKLQNCSYPIDTKHFDLEFKYKVLSQFDNIEEEVSGLLIKSENYQALKFLEPKYIDKKGDGKIKCIYIDPPYNTGNDGFVYKDSFKSASWLSMMNDRLGVAKGLMRTDGVIFTQIDDGEQDRLKKIKNLIFGNDCFVNTITVRSSTPSGLKTTHKDKTIIKTKDYINLYKKEKIHLYPQYIKQKKWDTHFSKYLDKKTLKIYPLIDILIKNKLLIEGQTLKEFDINNKNNRDFYIKNKNNIFQTAPEMPKEQKISSKKTPKQIIKYKDNANKTHYALNGRRFSFLENSINLIYDKGIPKEEISTLLCDLWVDIDFQNTQNEGKVDFPNGKKPEQLLQRVINLSINENNKEIVLDFFGGSGATAAVSYKMNKKFISVEMNDYFEIKMVKRLKYTMFGNSGGIPSQRDNGIFQYIELEQYDDIIDNLEVIDKDMAYDKAPLDYIYQPDKNKIAFRMDNEIKNPLDTNAKFDIFSSLIFHEGLELISINLDDADVLEAKVKDRYSKECFVVLGSDKKKVTDKIDTIKNDNIKIYTNHTILHTEQIMAETFKGK